MTEQQPPDEDVEGHRRHFFEDPEGTEGAEASEDDVEGHRGRAFAQSEDGDDVGGHLIRGVSQEEGSANPDDVEGHGSARL
jgi:hypothetical protein